MELSLPAGSLECAEAAFSAGADSVYFGLKSFSARAGAANFSFDDLRKARRLSLTLGKKIYVAINTILCDEDMETLIPMLRRLEFVGCDGVIVQDLGLAHLIKHHFPSLALHASTQLAVQDSDGVRFLKSAGFARVVLARELSLDEIRKIRNDCPDVELKVFIHGALCYSISGLCLASRRLADRSANCGCCAQICRNTFSVGDSEENVSCFSLEDLKVGEKTLKELDAMGIDALKVEGRLKGPEYVCETAAYYSALLKGNRREAEIRLERSQTAFARTSGEGYFHGVKPEFVTSDYAGHRGFPVGNIISGSQASVSVPLAARDGLMYVSKRGDAVKFACGGFYPIGSVIRLDGPQAKGGKLYRIKLHDANRPLWHDRLAPYRKPVGVDIEVRHDGISVNGKTYPIEISEARKPQNWRENLLNVFSQSSDSLFAAESVEIVNSSGFETPFMPLSSLKEIRRRFFEELDDEADKYFDSPADLDGLCPAADFPSEPSEEIAILLPVCFYEYSLPTGKTVELNNVSHLWKAVNSDVSVGIGDYLYCANRFTADFFRCLLSEKLRYIRPWVELDEARLKKLPIFISRACYRKTMVTHSCEGCPKDWTYSVKQGNKLFKVCGKNCITYTFAEEL